VKLNSLHFPVMMFTVFRKSCCQNWHNCHKLARLMLI